jgi:hypothetical protein
MRCGSCSGLDISSMTFVEKAYKMAQLMDERDGLLLSRAENLRMYIGCSIAWACGVLYCTIDFFSTLLSG